MQLDHAVTACFTGHRPDKLGGYNYNNPVMQRVSLEAAWRIWGAYLKGYRNFISGFAQGFDQEAASLVVRLRRKHPDVRLIAALPFEGQEAKWPEQAQLAYRLLLAEADQVEYVCEPGYAAWKMQKRNTWMVDRSSHVIAAWDGSDGGTANCIEYARNRPHIIQNIDLIDVATLR